MNSDFTSFCDDFFVNMDLHTCLVLPQERETVLHFCEAVQKQFPDMSDFNQRETGEYMLESDRAGGSYRWLGLEQKRLSSGTFNPPDTQSAYKTHSWLLDRSRYFMGVSGLDVESLDLVYGFNLDFIGNRDAIVYDAILVGSPLASLLGETGATVLNFEPALVMGLDSECSLQARLAVETRNTSYQVRTGQYEEDPISVYFTVRAHPRPGERFDLLESLARQADVGEDLLSRVVIPKVVRPIASAIAAQ